jgi:hypothetical protein
MAKTLTLIAIAALGVGGVAFAATTSGDPAPAQPAQAGPPQICKTVVGTDRGAKPYQLCMTKAEWDAKKIADAKDPNRMVCKYEQKPGTRLVTQKTCLTAAEWEAQRLATREAVEKIQMQTCVPGAGC